MIPSLFDDESVGPADPPGGARDLHADYDPAQPESPTNFIDDSTPNPPNGYSHNLLDNTRSGLNPSNGGTDGDQSPRMTSSITIAHALHSISDRYLLPSTCVTKPLVAAGTFVAGFIV